MATHTEIRAALVTVLGQMTIANGYSADLDTSKLRTGRNNIADTRQPAASGLNTLLCFHGNEYVFTPGRRIETTSSWSVTCVLVENADDPTETPLELRAEALISDMELLIARNQQFGGSDNVTLISAATDAGYATPEAVVAFDLSILYRKTY